MWGSWFSRTRGPLDASSRSVAYTFARRPGASLGLGEVAQGWCSS